VAWSAYSSVRARLALAALAVFCAVIGVVGDEPPGDFTAGAGCGVLAVFLVLHLASRRPAWSGVVPGLLGGMVASAIGMGWDRRRRGAAWSEELSRSSHGLSPTEKYQR
jgi:ABC-type cobalamin transport system permease subunit